MKKQVLTLLAFAAVSASAMAQTFIPNPGFETWGSSLGEDQQPSSWISYNIFTAPLIDATNSNTASVTQAGSPDNYQGNYSAKITTTTLINNPDPANIPYTAGFMMAGAVSFSSPYMLAGYANPQRPQTFSYAGKYTPVGTDTAICVVAVTKWNGTTRDTIGIGIDYMPVAVPNYTTRTVTVVYDVAFASTIPDTISILFSSSSFIAPQVGSSFWVDALSFSGYVGMNEIASAAGVSVYPNPSNDVTYFDLVSEEAASIAVYDMTGREVSRVNVNNKRAAVNSWTMPAGAYTYSVLNKEGEVMSRGKFSVTE